MAAGDVQIGPAVRAPSLVDAIVPLVILAVLIAGSLQLFGLDALDGPIQVALMLCCAAAALIGLKNGYHWSARALHDLSDHPRSDRVVMAIVRTRSRSAPSMGTMRHLAKRYARAPLRQIMDNGWAPQ